MNGESLKQKLDQILGTELRYVKLNETDWDTMDRAPGNSRIGIKDQILYFYVRKEKGSVQALSVEEIFLTVTERRLVEVLLDALESSDIRLSMSAVESEIRSAAIRDWLREQIDLGAGDRQLPESLAVSPALHTAKLPMLIHFGDGGERKHRLPDLKPLLESFFETEIILIPLYDQEWIVLGPETLVTAGMNTGEDEETLEEAVESMVSGLHDMLSSEWIGECHVAAGFPMVPARSLLSTVRQLREAVYLGRKYKVGGNIHLPWATFLEKLLDTVPDGEKQDFTERILKKGDVVLDTEMQNTIEQFFHLDCNVSETAKHLYIHRNTLLYRLDKFKQETGLDVRSFQDAVLVKIALQLYKVTKRP